MNIFVPFDSIHDNARVLDDRRLVKMVLETAQILCSALNHYDVPTAYRLTHSNHPCVRWAAQTRANYYYTCRLGKALAAEYTSRYRREHKSEAVILDCLRKEYNIPFGESTPHVNCTPFKTLPVREAYRTVLAAKWAQGKPRWFGGPATATAPNYQQLIAKIQRSKLNV